MLRVVIIEDELNAAKMLQGMLYELPMAIEVVEKCQDLPSGVKSIKKNSPDIVFLDIELPVYSGIQLLDFFYPEEINFHIIFTTAYNEFALKAFEMSAIDYLMKPVQAEKLYVAVNKVVQNKSFLKADFLPILKHNIENDAHKKLVVPVGNGLEILNTKEICYLKAEGSYTQLFFATTKTMLVSKNLKHFEFILSDNSIFIRIHRSYIVNINFAKKIVRCNGSILLLEDKTELPISEDKMEKLLNLLHSL